MLIAFCTGGAFVLYFNDAPTLLREAFALDVSPTVLAFVAGLTFSTYLMAGFAREQVCTYMCPYARFQSAMFDKDTLVIGYDEARGEKRGKHKKGDSWDGRGHCIDCSLCVQVCPMGIDIREGLQMECIACGLCVDACDGVMEKLELPNGLIRYDTENNIKCDKQSSNQNFKFIRPRTIYYSAVMALVGGIMLYALLNRSLLDITVIHDRNPLFVQLSGGEIRNGYLLKIQNKTQEHKTYTLSLDGLDNASIEVRAAKGIDSENIYVPADSVGTYHIFVIADVDPAEPRNITFTLKDEDVQDTYQSKFITRRD